MPPRSTPTPPAQPAPEMPVAPADTPVAPPAAQVAAADGAATNVVQALQLVMRDLPAIGKDSKAAADQGGYAYRGIEAITQQVQPLLARHGVSFVPRVVSWERDIVLVGRDRKEWHDDRMMIEYRVYGPGGPKDFIVIGPIPAIGRDGTDKGANKCMTQAFKYALLQVLCIADAKDDGDGHSVEQAGADVPPPPPNPDVDLAGKLLIDGIRDKVRTLREKGQDHATTDEDGTVTVLGVVILRPNDEGNITSAVTVRAAQALDAALAEKITETNIHACSIAECPTHAVVLVEGDWYCGEHRPPE